MPCGVCSIIVWFAFKRAAITVFNVRMRSAIQLFPCTARVCYVTFARTTNGNPMKQCACACVMAERRCSAHADVE